VDQEYVDAVDRAVTREFKRQEAQIPYYEGKPYSDVYGRHGGPLRKSLTNTADAFHEAVIIGNTIQVRSRVHYAKYQDLPEPDPRAVERAIGTLLLRRLFISGVRTY
jgi:hypothetical protein